MNIVGPLAGVEGECERVLRTLPLWFGIEESLLEYSSDTTHLPTFGAIDAGKLVGFLSLKEHFRESWELHCIAVDIEYRGKGIGSKLHEVAEEWLASRGVSIVQVKTLAESHPSPEYAETRLFYKSIGYTPIEIFQDLWGPGMTVLQLVKALPNPSFNLSPNSRPLGPAGALVYPAPAGPSALLLAPG